MKVIYTAIFGDYDTLKEPLVITPGWKYICYTDQDFESKVWEIKKVKLEVDNPQYFARLYKIKFYDYVETEFSIWIDGSFQIACNLNDWWDKYFKAPITCIQHPWRKCLYEEAEVCIEQNRGDAEDIQIQVKDYDKLGIKKNLGLIQSGILMRQKCEKINYLCEEWLEQVELYSNRDQISFSFIFKDYHAITNWKYFDNKDFIFTKHIKKHV